MAQPPEATASPNAVVGSLASDSERMEPYNDHIWGDVLMSNQQITSPKAIGQRILPILLRYGATRAGLFGSAARGEMRDNSEVDVLVELGPELSLLDIVRINREIEEALGRPVDMVEYDTIKPFMRDRILAEEVRML